jgi:hypothetical protein
VFRLDSTTTVVGVEPRPDGTVDLDLASLTRDAAVPIAMPSSASPKGTTAKARTAIYLLTAPDTGDESSDAASRLRSVISGLRSSEVHPGREHLFDRVS